MMKFFLKSAVKGGTCASYDTKVPKLRQTVHMLQQELQQATD